MDQRKIPYNNLLTVLTILLFIILDQVIKLYIKRNLMGLEFDIVGEILGFKSVINIDYSWINSMGQFDIGLMPHVILNVVIFLMFILVYDFISIKYKMSKLVRVDFCFAFAGIMCSLIDKIAWGGSLDYIWLKGFFIFDLKDIFLTCFEIITICMLVFNYKGLRKLEEKVIFKEFINYLRLRFAKGQ